MAEVNQDRRDMTEETVGDAAVEEEAAAVPEEELTGNDEEGLPESESDE